MAWGSLGRGLLRVAAAGLAVAVDMGKAAAVEMRRVALHLLALAMGTVVVAERVRPAGREAPEALGVMELSKSGIKNEIPDF